MDLVFEIPAGKKAELKGILEAEPYAEKSFSRNGYKMKDAQAVGGEDEKIYLYIKATDEFAKFAKEKLSVIAVECKPEMKEKVMKKIEEEESSAEVGLGSIFG